MTIEYQLRGYSIVRQTNHPAAKDNLYAQPSIRQGAINQQLQQAKQALDLMGFMTKLNKYRVILIDDIGYVKKTEGETRVLFEFIAHRYESSSLIITSNQPFSQWEYRGGSVRLNNFH